jgi:hypothetical protein
MELQAWSSFRQQKRRFSWSKNTVVSKVIQDFKNMRINICIHRYHPPIFTYIPLSIFIHLYPS